MLVLSLPFLIGFSSSAAIEFNGGTDLQKIELGKKIFFDVKLSVNGTQSCANCHDLSMGFTGPDPEINSHGSVEPGAIRDRFGNRKPPCASYAEDSPNIYYDAVKGGWFSGIFWDGRATGPTMGDPLAEQATWPFLNPLEMNMPGAKQVCIRVSRSDYAWLFGEGWGTGSLNCVKDPSGAYEKIAYSIAAYERSSEVNPFTSKFDLFSDIAQAAGKNVTKITAAETPRGMRWWYGI